MSSGQKAAYEEAQERAHEAHVGRLKSLGMSRLADKLDILGADIQWIADQNVPRTRNEFRAIERLQAAIRELL